MKFFSLIFKDDEISPNRKVLSPEAFSAVLDSQELLDKTKEDSEAYLAQTHKECERLQEEAKARGHRDGLEEWTSQLAFLAKETQDLRERVKEAIVPLAMASVKKIIGKELETRPETIISMISQALKDLAKHKQIVIHVNPKDLELVDQHRVDLKKIVEYADSLVISPKGDVTEGGCIIETEAGIINAQLDVQLEALEKAFATALQQKNPLDPKTPSKNRE